MYSRATTCTECEMHNCLFIDALGEGGDLARGSVGEGWWCWEVMVCKGIAVRRWKGRERRWWVPGGFVRRGRLNGGLISLGGKEWICEVVVDYCHTHSIDGGLRTLCGTVGCSLISSDNTDANKYKSRGCFRCRRRSFLPSACSTSN